MSTGVSESFFPNYYPPNMSSMSYPYMGQGLSGTEASWSNTADNMFGMGYDYGNVYSGSFGFPFNSWEYPNDYWSGSQPQPVRKDQRGYTEEPYYPSEMIPTDSYMMNGSVPPPEPQQPIGTVEQGMRNMSLAQPTSAAPPMDSRKKMVDTSQSPIMPDGGFGGGDPSITMPPRMPSNPSPGVISSGSGGSSHGQGSSKKTSWAAIASQPARQQQHMRPRTIPRAPVHPNKSMDIGTWDTRGNPVKPPMPMTQTLPSQPPPPRQSWATNTVRNRQIQPHSTSGPGNMASPNPGSSHSDNGDNNGNNSGGFSVSASSSTPPSNTNNSSGSGNTIASNDNSNNSSSNSSGGDCTNNSHSSNMTAPPVNNGYISNGGGTTSSSSYTNYPPSSTGSSLNSRHVVVSTNTTTTNGASNEVPQSSPVAVPSYPDSDLKAIANQYNPKDFDLNPKSARFFVIKSYSEDDIHRSIKYNIWCSTEHGNKRLNEAFREREGKGPVYLMFSVNGSGHFCGVAQMMTQIDLNKSAGVWMQDKWKGQFEVKWVYVKDIPNNQLRHIRLENNENKPVTNSRDTQEIPPEKGKQVLSIIHSYKHSTSIFDDFIHYDKRQVENQQQSQQQQHSMHRDNRGNGGGNYHHHQNQHHHHSGGFSNHRDRDHHHHGSHDRDRDNYHRNDHFRNEGRNNGGRGGDHRYDHRGDYRSEGREHHQQQRHHQGGFDRDHRERGDGRNIRVS